MPVLSELIAAFVSMIMAVALYSSLLTPKKNKWLTALLLLLVEGALNFSLLFFLQTQLFLKIAIFLVVDMAFMVVFYKESFARKLTLFVINYILAIASDTLGYFAYEFLVRAAGVAENYDFLEALVCILYVLLYSYAIVFLRRKGDSLNSRETLVALIALFLTYFALGVSTLLAAPPEGLTRDFSPARLITINFAIGLVLNIILLWLLKGMAKIRRVEAENAVLAEQNVRQLEHYESLSRYQNEIRELRHDISNHIDAAMTLFEQGDADKAAEYMSELRRRYRGLSAIDFCDNPVIDALLRNKAQLLGERGITYSFNVKLAADAGIDELSLVCVFSNLLDNAADAAALVKDSPFVRLSVRENAGFLFIKCENSADEAASPHEKSDGLRHGLGTGIIERTASEHDGSFERTITGGVCTCLCSLRATPRAASQTSLKSKTGFQ